MHRFFLPDAPLNRARPVDLSPLANQLSRVLRLEPGARIVVLPGDGRAFAVEITALDRRTATGRVVAEAEAPPPPPVALTLYPCSLKADKFEWVLQKGTELGVARFVPVISERSIVRPAAALLKKYERWRTIVREAAEQCGRATLPTLTSPLSWAEAVAATAAELSGEANALKLLPWEAERAGPSLLHVLQQQPQADAIHLLVGPEGGLAADEVAAARRAGWQTVSLGPLILRAETASIAAVAGVMAARWEARTDRSDGP